MRCDARLGGRTAVVAGEDLLTVREIVSTLSACGVNVAAASGQRIEDLPTQVHLVRGDIDDEALWQRTLAQVEQRLGPIDIAVGVGTATVLRAAAPDMSARGYGVALFVGEDDVRVAAPTFRQVPGGSPESVAAAVLAAATCG